ncbi:Sir2 family NAD-dependent protein deacetylase [Saccharomonospora sp. NPDC006951]
MREQLQRAAELIDSADALFVCAGAGMGVDSGLPDFRGAEGFWRAYPPYAKLGLRFAEVADPRHFAEDPELAWGFFGHRHALYRATTPHEGFGLLRSWGSGKRGGLHVFTSNVDGQFQSAGFESVAEVHGSIHHLQCFARCTTDIWPLDTGVPVDADTMRAVGPLPSCRHCGGLARPNILMFDDLGWIPGRTKGQLDELREWRASHRDAVVIEIGAGRAVPTVRRQAELASAANAALIRVNPHEAEVRHGRGVPVGADALPALRAIDALLTGG